MLIMCYIRQIPPRVLGYITLSLTKDVSQRNDIIDAWDKRREWRGFLSLREVLRVTQQVMFARLDWPCLWLARCRAVRWQQTLGACKACAQGVHSVLEHRHRPLVLLLRDVGQAVASRLFSSLCVSGAVYYGKDISGHRHHQHDGCETCRYDSPCSHCRLLSW